MISADIEKPGSATATTFLKLVTKQTTNPENDFPITNIIELKIRAKFR